MPKPRARASVGRGEDRPHGVEQPEIGRPACSASRRPEVPDRRRATSSKRSSPSMAVAGDGLPGAGGGKQDVEDQARLAASRYARDGGQAAGRELGVDRPAGCGPAPRGCGVRAEGGRAEARIARSRGAQTRPVTESGRTTSSAAVPSATIRPPRRPAPGPEIDDVVGRARSRPHRAPRRRRCSRAGSDPAAGRPASRCRGDAGRRVGSSRT